jgi:hypothetical protein
MFALETSRMATVHFNKAKKTGELNLSKQLSGIEDPHLHLWFGLDFIPGVADIDCVIWHEKIGVFVVEVKALPLPAIELFGLDRCHIKNRDGHETPQRQAYDGQECLRRFLRSWVKSPPYFVSTACWPLISREAWNRRWDDEYIRGNFAERMIFEEDIYSGPAQFRKRLEWIRSNPPIREPPKYPFIHYPEIFNEFKKSLDRTAAPKPAPSDLEKLRIIEEEVTARTLRQVPPRDARRVFYSGYPGTGKTFRLLQIGFKHAEAGCRVLFACFNKVLAADLRRILSHSQRLRVVQGSLIVTDVFDTLRSYAAEHKPLEWSEADYDTWGMLISEAMTASPETLTKYDTVLVDEAQDMKNWALEMLSLHAHADSTICIASGAGQELYGEASDWLKEFQDSAADFQLRRNFRNTRPVFQAAHVFFEAALDARKIAKAVGKFAQKRPRESEQPVLFERPEGNLPAVVYIDDSTLSNLADTDPFWPNALRECMIEEYSRLIREQLDRLEGDEKPLDLLVLVPSESGMERTWAVKALEKEAIAYIDYTDEVKRRDIAHPEMVRLCTFHSARGVEGTRVLVFGFEWIQKLVEESGQSVANLGYIVLSRSLFDCTLAVPRSSRAELIPFIIRIVEELRTVSASPGGSPRSLPT